MKLFERYVYTADKSTILKNTFIQNFFSQYNKSTKKQNLINWDYYSSNEDSNLLKHIIHEYLMLLHDLGFIDYNDSTQEAWIRQTDALTPPDKQFANLLKIALSVVNPDSINALDEIKKYLGQNLNSSTCSI